MDKIIKENGIWRSIMIESDAKKCHLNMTERLPVLSESDDYNECTIEWKYINGHKEGLVDEDGKKIKDSVCLCGKEIADQYYFRNDKTGNICIMGSECCKRINNTALTIYKESLKKKGSCWLCFTSHKDLDTHYNSKNHTKKVEEHMKKFNDSINTLLDKKISMMKEADLYELKLKTHRRCIENNCSNFIPIDNPEWKTRCLECYIKYIKIQKNKK
jgi:hypothetical protein